jgi:hypothetical protein
VAAAHAEFAGFVATQVPDLWMVATDTPFLDHFC